MLWKIIYPPPRQNIHLIITTKHGTRTIIKTRTPNDTPTIKPTLVLEMTGFCTVVDNEPFKLRDIALDLRDVTKPDVVKPDRLSVEQNVIEHVVGRGVVTHSVKQNVVPDRVVTRGEL